VEDDAAIAAIFDLMEGEEVEGQGAFISSLGD
jgi:hypothetical protein